MSQELHISFVTDSGWLRSTQRAIYDVIIRKNKDTRITFYVLLDNINDYREFDLFNSINNIKVIPISLNSKKEFPNARRYLQSWHNTFGYLRLIIPDLEIFKDIDRVLYLDVDVLTLKDLSDIYNVDLEDKPFGCVKDCYHIGYTDIHNCYITENGVDTGLIVMDLKKMRDICFTRLCRANICDVTSDYHMINTYFLQHNKYLNPEYQIPIHYITNGKSIFKDISAWNKFFKVKYESIEEFVKNSYTWHFRGNKNVMYNQYPIVRTAFDLSEQRLNDFLLSKQVMQWEPKDDITLTTFYKGM